MITFTGAVTPEAIEAAEQPTGGQRVLHRKGSV